MAEDRGERGRFARGNSIGARGGRPPRNYSIAHAMSELATMAETTDSAGNTLNAAQVVARWLWEVAKTGNDRRRPPDGRGEDVVTPVNARDRLEALKVILSRIEPEYKLTDKNANDGDLDEQAREVVAQLEKATPEELAVIEKFARLAEGK